MVARARVSRPVVVVLNRNALRLREEGALLRGLRQVEKLPSGSRVIETRSLTELEETARTVRAIDPSAVVLAGGDGTLMAGLSALKAAYGTSPLPDVAMVPGGTVCTVGRNFGVSGSPVRFAERLYRGLTAGTCKLHTTGTLSVRGDDELERIGFIFGFGLVSSFFEAYYGTGSRGRPGLGKAARIVAEVFAGSFVGGTLAKRILRPQPAEVSVTGERAQARAYSLFVASVLVDLGLHMHLTYRARERSGLFHAVGSALGPHALGPQMPLVIAGKKLLGQGVDALTDHVEVTFPSDRNSYVLDGELFSASRLDVRSGPELRLRTV